MKNYLEALIEELIKKRITKESTMRLAGFNCGVVFFLFSLVSRLLVTVNAEDTLESVETPAIWENINYDRVVDVSRTYISEFYDLKIRNSGEEPITQYFFALPKDVIQHISVFTASLEDEVTFLNSSILNTGSVTNSGVTIGYALITFAEPIQPNEEIHFLAKAVYNIPSKPYPASIDITDKQYLLFTSNRLPLSVYPITQSSLKIVGSNSFEEFETPENVHLSGKQEGAQFIFENWADIQPLEMEQPLKIIYEHNAPLNKVYNLNREVWVSHWAGTVQFEEYYELTNIGATLKNGFSRFEYMKNQMQHIQNGLARALIDNILPSGASDHYFTDLVGMVSTAQVQEDRYILKPRYPIFGGWKYNFTIGWTNPLSQFLHNDKNADDTYVLAVPVLNGAVDTAYDEVTLSFFLPEGAVVEEVDPPFAFSNLSIENADSYLDMGKGHVKISLSFNNLIDEIAMANIYVRYSYSSTSFYQKPLSVAAYIFVALISLFTLKQFNFSVSSKK